MPTDTTAEAHESALAPLLASVLSGVLTSLQGRMNGEISRVTGQPLEAAVWSFGSGLVLLTVLLLVVPRMRAGLGRVRASVRAGGLRRWQCIGGLLGGAFVAVQSYAVPLVGVALLTVAVVAGQTGNALVVDRFGLGPGGVAPVQPGRVIAGALAVVGVAVAMLGRGGGQTPVVLPAVLALLAGGGLAVQQALNGRVNAVSREVLSTTWLNFVLGTALLLVLTLVALLVGGARVRPLSGVPWWAWWGGVLGIGFVAIAAWAVHHLGVLSYGLAVLTGQLTSAVALDALSGSHPVVAPVLLGVGLTFAAALLGIVTTRRGRRPRPGRTAH